MGSNENVAANCRILIIGDLTVDIITSKINIGSNQSIKSRRAVGGSAINAAFAFKSYDLHPGVFGGVGDDIYGKEILNSLSARGIDSAVSINAKKPTCLINIIGFSEGDEYRTIFYDADNANDYNCNHLSNVLGELNLTYNDYIFVTLYVFPQLSFDLKHCRQIFTLLKQVNSNIIIDIVPHTLYEDLSFEDLKSIIDFDVHTIIAEVRTLCGFLEIDWENNRIPSDDEYQLFTRHFNSKYLDCRYGYGNIEFQTVLHIDEKSEIKFLARNSETGYLALSGPEKIGFGDVLTARLLKQYLTSS